jgi:hypothetical protein
MSVRAFRNTYYEVALSSEQLLVEIQQNPLESGTVTWVSLPRRCSVTHVLWYHGYKVVS